MTKEAFVAKYKEARATFAATLEGLSEAEASATTNAQSQWPSIKDIVGTIAAWEREVLIADEMIKRGEESHLADIDKVQFNAAQVAHRRSWLLAQVLAELDLNYEALLMAWDEYEGDDGSFGEATWTPDQPGSLWWLIEQPLEYGREIVRRRELQTNFPTQVV